MITNIITAEEFKAQISKPGKSIVDFSAEWCGPCKRIAPKFKELSEKYPTVRFYKLDIDQLSNLAQTYQIGSVPTFLIFNEGVVTGTVAGGNLVKIEEELNKTPNTPAEPISMLDRLR